MKKFILTFFILINISCADKASKDSTSTLMSQNISQDSSILKKIHNNTTISIIKEIYTNILIEDFDGIVSLKKAKKLDEYTKDTTFYIGIFNPQKDSAIIYTLQNNKLVATLKIYTQYIQEDTYRMYFYEHGDEIIDSLHISWKNGVLYIGENSYELDNNSFQKFIHTRNLLLLGHMIKECGVENDYLKILSKYWGIDFEPYKITKATINVQSPHSDEKYIGETVFKYNTNNTLLYAKRETDDHDGGYVYKNSLINEKDSMKIYSQYSNLGSRTIIDDTLYICNDIQTKMIKGIWQQPATGRAYIHQYIYNQPWIYYTSNNLLSSIQCIESYFLNYENYNIDGLLLYIPKQLIQ